MRCHVVVFVHISARFEAFRSVTLTYDTLVIKYLSLFVLFVSLLFMVLLAQVVLCEQIRVLGQRGANLLLLLKTAGVGDLDMAAFGGRFIHDLLQPGVELAVRVVRRGIPARVVFVPSVGDVLRWDFIQNLRLRLRLAGKCQLPPACVSHGTNGDGTNLDDGDVAADTRRFSHM